MKYLKVPSCKPDSTDVWTRCFFSLCTLKASLSEWDKSFNFLFDNDVFSTSFCSSEFIKQEVKTCFCCGCWKCQLKKNKVCEDKEGIKLQWMLEDVLWSVDLSRFSQTCCWWWWRWWSLSADSWLVLSGLVWLSDVSCYSSVWLKTTNGSLIHDSPPSRQRMLTSSVRSAAARKRSVSFTGRDEQEDFRIVLRYYILIQKTLERDNNPVRTAQHLRLMWSAAVWWVKIEYWSVNSPDFICRWEILYNRSICRLFSQKSEFNFVSSNTQKWLNRTVKCFSLLLEPPGVHRVKEPSAASVRCSGVVGSGRTGLQQDSLGAGWCFSLWSCDRKWRHLSALRYNGDHIAVTLGSLYRHPPPPTSPPPSPRLPLTPPDSPSALIVRGEMFRTAAASQSDLRESESRISLQVCTGPGQPPPHIHNLYRSRWNVTEEEEQTVLE